MTNKYSSVLTPLSINNKRAKNEMNFNSSARRNLLSQKTIRQKLDSVSNHTSHKILKKKKKLVRTKRPAHIRRKFRRRKLTLKITL